MFRIKQSSIAQTLEEGNNHSFTASQGDDGYYTLTIDDKALLENARGEIRRFRKLDTLVSLVKGLGVDSFSVSLNLSSTHT
ncbi:MAG: hypothetical protein WCP96_11435 [Methylococcaceae bacterium]